MSAPLIEQFDLLAASLGGVAKLRELILNLAVRGKLVPQDPSDEPASELLKKVRSEKDRLIAEGKIKRDKSVIGGTSDAEVPCGLPDGWAWASFANLGWFAGGKTPSTSRSDYWGGDIPWVTPKDMKSLVISDAQDKVTRRAQEDGLTLFEANSVMVVVRSGILRRTVPVAINSVPCTVNQDLKVLSLAMPSMAAYVLLMVRGFEGFILQDLTKVGTTVESIRFDDFEKQAFPLPPLAEQSRIVAKVEELMALCDRLEAEQGHAARVQGHWVEAALDQLADSADADEFRRHWQHLAEHFDTLFTTPESIDRLDATLLQLAVRGKLVPQDPADEPASELLKHIRAEKDRLIAEGKIKRDKPLPSIADDEKPLALPKGWAWARFPELGEFGRGKSKHRPRNDPALFNPGIYPLVQTGEVSRANRIVREYHSKYSDIGLAQSKMWPAGTLCITIAANIAESALLGFDACFPDSVVGFIPAQPIGDAHYFLTFIETARERLLEFAPATAQKNINLEILQSVLIPVPPLDEMRRIIAQVEKLQTLTATLKARLSAAQTKQAHLASTLITEVV